MDIEGYEIAFNQRQSAKGARCPICQNHVCDFKPRVAYAADARVIPRRADFEGEAPNEPASRKVVVLIPNTLSCRTPYLPNQKSFSGIVTSARFTCQRARRPSAQTSNAAHARQQLVFFANRITYGASSHTPYPIQSKNDEQGDAAENAPERTLPR